MNITVRDKRAKMELLDPHHSRYCRIWSVWNDTSKEWATATGFSTQAEAQALSNKCRNATNGISYIPRVREEYSFMKLGQEAMR